LPEARRQYITSARPDGFFPDASRFIGNNILQLTVLYMPSYNEGFVI